MSNHKKKVLITGSAGFIGAALAQKLINNNFAVVGVDNLNEYYDVKLKNDRLLEIKKASINFPSNKWSFYNYSIETNKLIEVFSKKDQILLLI